MQQMPQSIIFIAPGLGRSMEMIGNAHATSNNANSQNPYFSQNTFARNIQPASNNVQYSQGAHQFRVLMVFLLVVAIIETTMLRYQWAKRELTLI